MSDVLKTESWALKDRCAREAQRQNTATWLSEMSGPGGQRED
jgi:hypothetical protein